MPFPKHRLFHVSVGVDACVYAKSAEEAVEIFLRLRQIASADFDVNEVEQEDEIPVNCSDLPPISEENINQQKLSSSQILENLQCIPKIEAALCQPSDFPIVPELDPAQDKFMDVIWELVNTPSQVDWKLRNYLLLRYPKLRDALIGESNARLKI